MYLYVYIIVGVCCILDGQHRSKIQENEIICIHNVIYHISKLKVRPWRLNFAASLLSDGIFQIWGFGQYTMEYRSNYYLGSSKIACRNW